MAEPRSTPGWLMPLVAGTIAIAVLVLVAVPVAAILAGAGPFGDDGPEQPPVITNDSSVTVTIVDFTYFPEDLTINAGATVTWVNEDSAPHDAADRDETWNTELLNQGDSDAVTFDAPGTFEYYCTIHPFMEGVITVR